MNLKITRDGHIDIKETVKLKASIALDKVDYYFVNHTMNGYSS